MFGLPSAEKHGWVIEKKYVVRWLDGPAACIWGIEWLMLLISCGCKTNCATKSCSCMSQGFIIWLQMQSIYLPKNTQKHHKTHKKNTQKYIINKTTIWNQRTDEKKYAFVDICFSSRNEKSKLKNYFKDDNTFLQPYIYIYIYLMKKIGR